jgi:hypothetical protein
MDWTNKKSPEEQLSLRDFFSCRLWCDHLRGLGEGYRNDCYFVGALALPDIAFAFSHWDLRAGTNGVPNLSEKEIASISVEDKARVTFVVRIRRTGDCDLLSGSILEILSGRGPGSVNPVFAGREIGLIDVERERNLGRHFISLGMQRGSVGANRAGCQKQFHPLSFHFLLSFWILPNPFLPGTQTYNAFGWPFR